MKIKNTDKIHQEKLKIVLYGQSGSGKTSSIKTLPHNKTFVINTESGLLSLSGTGIDYVDIAIDDDGNQLNDEQRLNRMKDVMKFLATDEAKNKYENIVVDSLTEFGEIFASYWKAKITDKAKSFELWGRIGESQISFIKAMRDMKDYNVIFVCLEDIQKDEESRRFYGPDIPGNTAKSFLLPAFDLVFRLMVEKNGNRYLQTQPLATTLAKDRSGKLNPQEPADLGLIFKKVKGEK